MSRTLRWVCALLPCVPGLTMLAAGLVTWAGARDGGDRWRAQELFLAGGGVVLAGVVIGMIVAWRIAHPRPEEEEEDLPPPAS